MAKKVAEFKPPKSLAACADLLYTTRQERLDLQKKVDELKAKETILTNHLIDNLPKNDATGILGKVAKVTRSEKEAPQVNDWDALYAFIHKKKAYELLGRSVSSTAVKEYWDNKKDVPGIGKFIAIKLSVTKV